MKRRENKKIKVLRRCSCPRVQKLLQTQVLLNICEDGTYGFITQRKCPQSVEFNFAKMKHKCAELQKKKNTIRKVIG